MGHLSVKIPDYLYQQLESKAQEMGGLNLSDVVRILLSSAIEYPQTKINIQVQKNMLKHIVTIYYLMKEQLVNSLGNGSELNNLAHERAEKAMKKILEEYS